MRLIVPFILLYTGIDLSTETKKLVAVMIVKRKILGIKGMALMIYLMVKVKEKVFIVNPCPVFLRQSKVGDFFLGFGKA